MLNRNNFCARDLAREVPQRLASTLFYIGQRLLLFADRKKHIGAAAPFDSSLIAARRSKILGIAWEDVDLKTGMISFAEEFSARSVQDRENATVFTPLRPNEHVANPASTVRVGADQAASSRAARAALCATVR